MQHFLLSSAARTLSLKAVFRMGEDAAYETFRKLRWPETDGEAVCPRCGCVETYEISTRRRFKCVACHHQFSVTSGTIFASRKMSYTDLLAAIVIFCNTERARLISACRRALSASFYRRVFRNPRAGGHSPFVWLPSQSPPQS